MRVYLNIYQYACVYQYIYMKEITLEGGGRGESVKTLMYTCRRHEAGEQLITKQLISESPTS
jgi:hypothetical protein